jgi:hypothetical protein
MRKTPITSRATRGSASVERASESVVPGQRPMTERQLQEAVVSLARLLNYRIYHTFLSVRSAPGFPDLIAVRASDGRLHAIELKSGKGKVSAAQQAWLDDLAAAGVATHVFYPADWFSGRIEEVLR